jgi:hypothetical protein
MDAWSARVKRSQGKRVKKKAVVIHRRLKDKGSRRRATAYVVEGKRVWMVRFTEEEWDETGHARYFRRRPFASPVLC